jgi:7-carboxy-7-deazaguanine synthase (Cx14CxxC type)
MYSVKEIFYTLQGEGAQSGSAAIFCRFSKCNLWSGRESERSKAICTFCDTNFVGTDGQNGGEYSASDIVSIAQGLIPLDIRLKDNPILVVFTGGEPALQLTTDLVASFKELGFRTAIETNGTLVVPNNLDWITVSPKAGTKLKQLFGSELKIVFPQIINPKEYEDLDFLNFYLSPMMTSNELQNKTNIDQCVQFCLANPKWKLSYQNHKIWQID